MAGVIVTLRLAAYDPRVWRVALTLAVLGLLLARCDDFSTYPKG